MAKSILYLGTMIPQTLTAGDRIDLGIALRKSGCNLNADGGNIVAKGQGYYEITSRFDLTAGAGGTATITLYKDGVPIPGATTSFSVANSVTYTATIPACFKSTCCCDANIYAELTGVNGTILSTATTVTKEI